MLEAAELPGVRRALKRAERGVSVDAGEAEALLHARGDLLDGLVRAAGRQRDAGLAAAGRSGLVTYSRKVFIPLTRLCRDRCHYCTFVTTPGELRGGGHGMFMTPDEVLEVARRGAAVGCREALFTLGDRPEERWPAAREWLESHGYLSTLGYVRAMSIRVLEETGLLPHLNPGVMSWDEVARLKPVAASMGMMLETTSTRLFTERGGAHFGSPDKDPAVRLRVLEDAGRQSIPFTTGILVGIGETLTERVESLFAIRRVARAYGHVQEVIVQNFRAKPDTAMRSTPDVDFDDYLATVAVARLVLGPKVRLQVPPNLSAPSSLARLLAAGVDDWGGVSPVTPDHVNPERPWPQLDDLTRWSAEAVRRRPYQVILFDEVEKAHPDVFNVLLQVLDDGRLTDGQGRTVDFRNTLIVLTSNLGSEILAALPEGKDVASVRGDVMEMVRAAFRPEFLNRLDEILIFRRLSRDDMKGIVTIQLAQLQKLLADRKIALALDDKARAWLADAGYDPVYGARPLKRVIQRELQNPLAEFILNGRVVDGETVAVTTGEGGLAIAGEVVKAAE